MTDEPGTDQPQDAGGGPRGRQNSWRTNDARYYQRNLANRLFPGPSKVMSKQEAEQVEGLLRPVEASRRPRPSRDRGDSGAAGTPAAPAASEPLNVATPEDIAQVREALDAQNELLRALLASSVDTQNDARSTAQNSRTFAWAGTVIALLTLVATVVSIVAVVQAH